MDTVKGIEHVEARWLKPVSVFMEAHFGDIFLPSHDLSHHLRTWRYARQMLLELGNFNHTISPDILEAVLLSCLFHDSGMVTTRAKEHGDHSVVVYDRFLNESSMDIPSQNQEIKHAIREHDNKEEVRFIPFTSETEPDLLTILSIADNLDALGIIGIYRYAEIYLHRGIPLRSLGTRILENCSIRYQQLSNATVLLPYVMEKHAARYREITTFFEHYNKQLLAQTETHEVHKKHLGVIQFIATHCVNGTTRPEALHLIVDPEKSGKFVLNYFQKLHDALSDPFQQEV